MEKITPKDINSIGVIKEMLEIYIKYFLKKKIKRVGTNLEFDRKFCLTYYQIQDISLIKKFLIRKYQIEPLKLKIIPK
jgi:hypothetical protein